MIHQVIGREVPKMNFFWRQSLTSCYSGCVGRGERERDLLVECHKTDDSLSRTSAGGRSCHTSFLIVGYSGQSVMTWSSVCGLVRQGQQASFVIFHLVRLSLVLHTRVRNRLRVHHFFRGRSAPSGNSSLAARCILSCHLTSRTDSGSSGEGTQYVSHVVLLIRGFGGLYLSRGFLSLVSLYNLVSASVLLLISGGEIPERTYRSSRGVGLRQPVITRQASFRIGSILEAFELFDQTGAQNSPVEKTRLRAAVLMVLAFPSCLKKLTLVCSFFFSFTMWCL